MTSIPAAGLAPARPYSPQPARTPIRAGGAPSPEPVAPSSPAVSVVQQLLNALSTFFKAFAGWLTGLFRKPVAPLPPATPVTPGLQPGVTPLVQPPPSLALPSQSPLDTPWVPLKEVSNADGSLSAGVGLTTIAEQTGIGGRLDARMGETRLQAIAAHTTSDALRETVAAARLSTPSLQAEAVVRDRNGQVSAEGSLAATIGETSVRGAVRHAEGEGTLGTLAVTGRNVQATIAGLHQGDRTVLSGQLAASIGNDGKLTAQGAYERTPETTQASFDARYSDATTDLGIRYRQENEMRALGAHLDKRFAHSTLAIGGDYLKSPEGDGGKVYGRWQTDAIGERAFGYQIRGEMEAGAVKLPGQDWNTYASGRIVGEKENTSFFVGVEHQQGPMFSRPDTRVNAGIQIRF